MYLRSVLLFILFGFQIQAQSHLEAKALLDKASQTMKSFPALEIDFSYSFENTRIDPPIRQKQGGTIGIKGEDYRLKVYNLEKLSMEQLRVGSKLYTILHDDEEVQLSDFEEEEDQGLTPSKLLSLFQSGYSYKFAGTEKVGNRKIQYVLLKPNASEEIEKIQIGIDSKSHEVYSMQQWGTNGTLTSLKVEKLRKKQEWPSDYFQFNEADYSDYYISE